MAADPAHRRQLGELLVEKGVLTDAQLQLALAEQERSGEPLGEILVRLGFTKGPTIGNALAEQHGGPLRTEYGLALGPTQVLGMPPEHPEPTDDRGPAGDGAPVGRLRIADPTREQDTAIARLTAALNERTQELDRVQADLAQASEERARYDDSVHKLEQQLEQARTQQDETADTQRAHDELQLALEQHKADLIKAREERTQHADRANELEQQLEQARTRHDETADTERRLAMEQHEAELAAARADLEALQRELAEAREERTRHAERANELERQLEQARARDDETADTERARDELRLAKERHEAELNEAREERTQHASRAGELEQQLEQARAQHDETAGSRHTLRDLELTLEEHKAELAAIKTELSHAHKERTQHADRAHELEEQLEQARIQQDEAAEAQRVLVATAKARAERRYGPPLRTAGAQEAGDEAAPDRESLEAGERTGNTAVHEAGGITIRLWQLALFIVLVPVLLYVLVPVSAPLAAGSVVLLAAVLVMNGRRASRAAKRASPGSAAKP